MGKQQGTVFIDGEELPPYHVNENLLNNTNLGEFLENMPYQNAMLVNATQGKRVALNGREVEVRDWYTTTLAGEEWTICEKTSIHLWMWRLDQETSKAACPI